MPLAALALLSGCAGGSTAPNAPSVIPQTKHIGRHSTSSCPCLYVANISDSSVTVYAAGATGNAAPIQTISGNATTLVDPTGVAVDAAGNIYVADAYGGGTGHGAVDVFAAGANGNVAPTTTVRGAGTGLYSPKASPSTRRQYVRHQ